MVGSIYDWSKTPGSNASSDAAINWNEFQDPDTVNNSARQMMARHAEWIGDNQSMRASTGAAANTYAITIDSTMTLTDKIRVLFVPHQNNTGDCTLSVNTFGAIPMRPASSVAFKKDEIQSGVPVVAVYRAASNEWLVENQSGYWVNKLAPSLLTSNTFGLKVGDVKLSLSSSPDAGFIRLKETAQTLLKASYPDLNTWASAQGYPWGSAATTFNVPPAGGYFLRFGSSDATVDPNGPRAAGTTQADAFKSHTHTGTTDNPTTTPTLGTFLNPTAAVPNNTGPQGVGQSVSPTLPNHVHTFTTNATGDPTETRAKNVTMYADMLAVPALVATGLLGAGGLYYKFDTGTAASDPGAGFLRLNNATPSSAAALYMSETDANGQNIAAVLQGIPNASALFITKIGSPSNWIYAPLASAAVDNGVWDAFVTGGGASGGTIAQGDPISVCVMRAGAAGPTGPAGGAPLPNLLVNGDFQLNQRAFAGGALAVGVYGFDRWKADTGGANCSLSGYTLTLTSGIIMQVVEPAVWGYANLSLTAITVSVDTPSADLTITVGSSTGTITAGSGRRSVTITTQAGDTGNINVKITKATAGTVTLGRVKAEVGSTSSGWTSRDGTAELRLSWRYYEALSGATGDRYIMRGYATNTGTMYYPIVFQSKKRAAPTVALTAVSQTNASAATALNPFVYGFEFSHAVSVASGFTFFGYTADAEL